MSGRKEQDAYLAEAERRRQEEERRRREEARKQADFDSAKKAALRECAKAMDVLKKLESNPFASQKDVADYQEKIQGLRSEVERYSSYSKASSLKATAATISSLESKIQRFASVPIALNNRRCDVERGAVEILNSANSTSRFDRDYWLNSCRTIVDKARSCSDESSLVALEVSFREIAEQYRKVDDKVENDEKRLKTVQKRIRNIEGKLKRLEGLDGIKEEIESLLGGFESSTTWIKTRLTTPEQGCELLNVREILETLDVQIGEMEEHTKYVLDLVEASVSKKIEIESRLNDLKKTERRIQEDEAAPYLTSNPSAYASYSSYRAIVDEICRSLKAARNLDETKPLNEKFNDADSKLEEAFAFALDAWIQANIALLREKLSAKRDAFRDDIFQKWARKTEPDEFERLIGEYITLDEESLRCDERQELASFGKRVAKWLERASKLTDKIERIRERFDRQRTRVLAGKNDETVISQLAELISFLKDKDVGKIPSEFRNEINDVVKDGEETRKRVDALLNEADDDLDVEKLNEAVVLQEAFAQKLAERSELVDLWRQTEEFRLKVQPLIMTLFDMSRGVYEKIDGDIREIMSLLLRGDSDKARRLLDKTRVSNAELLAKADQLYKDREKLRRSAEKVKNEVLTTWQNFFESELERFLSDDESSSIRELLKKTELAYDRGEYDESLARSANLNDLREKKEELCRRRLELSDIWNRFTVNGQAERMEFWANDAWNKCLGLYAETRRSLEERDGFDLRLANLKDSLSETLDFAQRQEGVLGKQKEDIRKQLAELEVKLDSILPEERRDNPAYKLAKDEIDWNLGNVAQWSKRLERLSSAPEIEKIESSVQRLQGNIQKIVDDFELCSIAAAYANALKKMNYAVSWGSNEDGVTINASFDDPRKRFGVKIPREKDDAKRKVEYDFENGIGFQHSSFVENGAAYVQNDGAEDEIERLCELLNENGVQTEELKWRARPPKRQTAAEVVRDGSDTRRRERRSDRYMER